MEVCIVNHTQDSSWETYEDIYHKIAKKSEEVLKLRDDYIVSVIFVTPEMIHEINRDYRGIDRPTDVISFALHDSEDAYEMMEGEEELGDIFINIEAIKSQALDYGHSIYREACFLFTHGLLHLLGYDHMNETDEKEMFQLQDVILNEIASR